MNDSNTEQGHCSCAGTPDTKTGHVGPLRDRPSDLQAHGGKGSAARYSCPHCKEDWIPATAEKKTFIMPAVGDIRERRTKLESLKAAGYRPLRLQSSFMAFPGGWVFNCSEAAADQEGLVSWA